jgi:hypothetical protein
VTYRPPTEKQRNSREKLDAQSAIAIVIRNVKPLRRARKVRNQAAKNVLQSPTLSEVILKVEIAMADPGVTVDATAVVDATADVIG